MRQRTSSSTTTTTSTTTDRLTSKSVNVPLTITGGNKHRRLSTKQESFDEYNIEDDINYYLVSKKSTPEFSGIDDDKIRKYVIEARKAVDMFKTND